MTERERVAAELRAAVEAMKAREAELTPLERLKLKSLLLNLQRLPAAPPLAEEGAATDCEVPETCNCTLCNLD